MRSTNKSSDCLKKPWVRLVLAISLDGRLALTNGGTESIGGEEDRKVLEKSLSWADATLLGGGTLRAHKNTCIIRDPKLIKTRRDQGKEDQPIAIVISNLKNFCLDWSFFQQPLRRWLITSNLKEEENKLNLGFEYLLSLGLGWEKILETIHEKGIKNLMVLGGGNLIGSLLQEDLIDELQLTLTSKIIGGKNSWVPFERDDLPLDLTSHAAWQIKERVEISESELLLRYYRNRG